MQSFTPSKLVWTEADFEEMSWHDCRLHGIGLIDDFYPHSHELCLDIDYILQWRRAAAGDECDGFWISPATLVFTPESFHIHFAGLSGSWIISIDRGAMISDCYEWLVRLNTGGSITISAPGTVSIFGAHRFLSPRLTNPLKRARGEPSVLTPPPTMPNKSR